MARFRQVYIDLRFIHGSVYTDLRFIHDSVYTGLYRPLFYSWLGLDRFIQTSVLFMAQFRHVYTDLRFIHGSV